MHPILIQTPSAAEARPKPMTPETTIRRLSAPSEPEIHGLAQLLIACVAGGASVGFMHPLALDRALAFWRRIAVAAEAGQRGLLVAEQQGVIVGTVQVLLDQPDNQPHRADLAKMLVLPQARCQGLGSALMRAAERLCLECGKSLLVLDTATGSPAERLYTGLGWERCGVIPDYALWPCGGLTATTVFYKRLTAEPTISEPES